MAESWFLHSFFVSTVIAVGTLVVVSAQFGRSMFVCIQDFNFGGFRIPHVYACAHKWREHQALADQPLSNFTVRMRNELRRTYFDQYFHHLVWFFFFNTVSPLTINIAIYSTKYQGKMVLSLVSRVFAMPCWFYNGHLQLWSAALSLTCHCTAYLPAFEALVI